MSTCPSEGVALEKCIICLSLRRCAHTRQHPCKDKPEQLCGPWAICVPCSGTICKKFTRGKEAALGQFSCPVCKAELGPRRRALEEGSDIGRWEEELASPDEWKMPADTTTQQAMRERNLPELRRLLGDDSGNDNPSVTTGDGEKNQEKAVSKSSTLSDLYFATVPKKAAEAEEVVTGGDEQVHDENKEPSSSSRNYCKMLQERRRARLDGSEQLHSVPLTPSQSSRALDDASLSRCPDTLMRSFMTELAPGRESPKAHIDEPKPLEETAEIAGAPNAETSESLPELSIPSQEPSESVKKYCKLLQERRRASFAQAEPQTPSQATRGLDDASLSRCPETLMQTFMAEMVSSHNSQVVQPADESERLDGQPSCQEPSTSSRNFCKALQERRRMRMDGCSQLPAPPETPTQSSGGLDGASISRCPDTLMRTFMSALVGAGSKQASASSQIVKLKGSVFTKPHTDGDFEWMIEQDIYPKGLYVFNDNTGDHFSARPGGGNAVIRPLNRHGSKDTPAKSAGICTGDPGRGFESLSSEAKTIIDRDIDEIRVLLATCKYDHLIYSAVEGDPSLLGTGIFQVGLDVRSYIVKQLQQFDGCSPSELQAVQQGTSSSSDTFEPVHPQREAAQQGASSSSEPCEQVLLPHRQLAEPSTASKNYCKMLQQRRRTRFERKELEETPAQESHGLDGASLSRCPDTLLKAFYGEFAGQPLPKALKEHEAMQRGETTASSSSEILPATEDDAQLETQQMLCHRDASDDGRTEIVPVDTDCRRLLFQESGEDEKLCEQTDVRQDSELHLEPLETRTGSVSELEPPRSMLDIYQQQDAMIECGAEKEQTRLHLEEEQREQEPHHDSSAQHCTSNDELIEVEVSDAPEELSKGDQQQASLVAQPEEIKCRKAHEDVNEPRSHGEYAQDLPQKQTIEDHARGEEERQRENDEQKRIRIDEEHHQAEMEAERRKREQEKAQEELQQKQRDEQERARRETERRLQEIDDLRRQEEETRQRMLLQFEKKRREKEQFLAESRKKEAHRKQTLTGSVDNSRSQGQPCRQEEQQGSEKRIDFDKRRREEQERRRRDEERIRLRVEADHQHHILQQDATRLAKDRELMLGDRHPVQSDATASESREHEEVLGSSSAPQPETPGQHTGRSVRSQRQKNGSADVQQLLQTLDDLTYNMVDYEVKVSTCSEAVFDCFDISRTGVLEGDQYSACIDALLGYMQKECKRELLKVLQKEEGHRKLPNSGTNRVLDKVRRKSLPDDRLRRFIAKTIDPNNIGKITKKRALAGFKTVVDKIEDDATKESQRKLDEDKARRSLEAQHQGEAHHQDQPQTQPQDIIEDKTFQGHPVAMSNERQIQTRQDIKAYLERQIQSRQDIKPHPVVMSQERQVQPHNIKTHPVVMSEERQIQTRDVKTHPVVMTEERQVQPRQDVKTHKVLMSEERRIQPRQDVKVHPAVTSEGRHSQQHQDVKPHPLVIPDELQVQPHEDIMTYPLAMAEQRQDIEAQAERGAEVHSQQPGPDKKRRCIQSTQLEIEHKLAQPGPLDADIRYWQEVARRETAQRQRKRKDEEHQSALEEEFKKVREERLQLEDRRRHLDEQEQSLENKRRRLEESSKLEAYGSEASSLGLKQDGTRPVCTPARVTRGWASIQGLDMSCSRCPDVVVQAILSSQCSGTDESFPSKQHQKDIVGCLTQQDDSPPLAANDPYQALNMSEAFDSASEPAANDLYHVLNTPVTLDSTAAQPKVVSRGTADVSSIEDQVGVSDAADSSSHPHCKAQTQSPLEDSCVAVAQSSANANQDWSPPPPPDLVVSPEPEENGFSTNTAILADRGIAAQPVSAEPVQMPPPSLPLSALPSTKLATSGAASKTAETPSVMLARLRLLCEAHKLQMNGR